MPSTIEKQQAEYEWLLKVEAAKVFHRIKNILSECCLKLPIASKSSDSQVHSYVEKYTLSSPIGDNVKCVVTLLGDNIVHLEATIRYQKAPGHFYRAIAQPDVQWKMHQIQDLSDYVLKALSIVNVASDIFKSPGGVDGLQISTYLENIIINLHNGRSSVMLPKKKSITELQENRINKCFIPALPADLLLSFYISSAKLICAAYHMQSQTATGRQTFIVYQGECVVNWLHEIITYINCSLQLCQQLRDKLSVFHGSFVHLNVEAE